MTRTKVCFLAGWAFWKKLCVVNAGPDAQLRFHSISDTAAEMDYSGRKCREKNVPKTNNAILVNRLRCGTSLPFRKNMGKLEKARQEIDRRVDLAVSIANPESAGRGSIDEVRQSFHADEVHAGCHSSHKITAP